MAQIKCRPTAYRRQDNCFFLTEAHLKMQKVNWYGKGLDPEMNRNRQPFWIIYKSYRQVLVLSIRSKTLQIQTLDRHHLKNVSLVNIFLITLLYRLQAHAYDLDS